MLNKVSGLQHGVKLQRVCKLLNVETVPVSREFDE